MDEPVVGLGAPPGPLRQPVTRLPLRPPPLVLGLDVVTVVVPLRRARVCDTCVWCGHTHVRWVYTCGWTYTCVHRDTRVRVSLHVGVDAYVWGVHVWVGVHMCGQVHMCVGEFTRGCGHTRV